MSRAQENVSPAATIGRMNAQMAGQSVAVASLITIAASQGNDAGG